VKIESPNIRTNILWGAIVTHAVILLAAPCIAIAAIFKMGSRSPYRHTDHKGYAETLLSDNVELVAYILMASLIIIGVAFIYIYYRNAKRRYIVGFEFLDHEKMLELSYKSYYQNKIRKVKIAYLEIICAEVPYEESIKVHQLHPDILVNVFKLENKIHFKNSEGKYIGEVSNSGTYWNNQGAKIKMVLTEIVERKNRGLQES